MKKMLLVPKLLVLVVFVQQVVSFQQHKYRLIHEKFMIDDYNKDVVENPDVTLFNFNDTSIAYNGSTTIKVDMSEDIWAHSKIYQMTEGGEYRLFPTKFSLNICEIQKRDTFGTREIYEHSNMTDCPFKAGTYYLSNYRPDESKFPPYVPYGKLMVTGKVYDGNVFVASGRWWGRVEAISN